MQNTAISPSLISIGLNKNLLPQFLLWPWHLSCAAFDLWFVYLYLREYWVTAQYCDIHFMAFEIIFFNDGVVFLPLPIGLFSMYVCR